jgi:hypothetical protein
LTEKHPHVKLFFKKFGTAIRIAEVFGGVPVRADLHSDRAALKGSIDIGDVLSMRMIERFGDAKNGSEAASHALVAVTQRRIRCVMAGWIGLAIVIADQRGHNGTIAARKTRNISVERQVFAVFMVAPMADHVAGIVEKRACFEKHA